MTTKEKLLTLFEKNKGVYFSRRCLHQRSPSGKSRRRSAGGLCAHRNQCLSSRKRFSRRTQKYSRSCFFRSHGRRQKPPGRRVSQLFYGAVSVFGGQLLYTGIPGTQFPYREEILVLLPEGTKKASALDVDGECRLIVRYKDGTVAALDSGEVRVQERKHLHTPTE